MNFLRLKIVTFFEIKSRIKSISIKIEGGINQESEKEGRIEEEIIRRR